MLVRFLNGEFVEISDALNDEQIREWLRTRIPSGCTASIIRDPIDNEVVHVLFTPLRLTLPKLTKLRTYNLLFLSTATNESLLALFLPHIKHHPSLWENPHPLIVDAALTSLTRPLSHLSDDEVMGICTNPDDRIVEELLTRHPEMINCYDFCRNPNPRAQDWIIANFGRLRLNVVHLCEMFRHPYEPSIRFVWDRLLTARKYTELITLPHNPLPLVRELKHNLSQTLKAQNKVLRRLASGKVVFPLDESVEIPNHFECEESEAKVEDFLSNMEEHNPEWVMRAVEKYPDLCTRCPVPILRALCQVRDVEFVEKVS